MKSFLISFFIYSLIIAVSLILSRPLRSFDNVLLASCAATLVLFILSAVIPKRRISIFAGLLIAVSLLFAQMINVFNFADFGDSVSNIISMTCLILLAAGIRSASLIGMDPGEKRRSLFESIFPIKAGLKTIRRTLGLAVLIIFLVMFSALALSQSQRMKYWFEKEIEILKTEIARGKSLHYDISKYETMNVTLEQQIVTIQAELGFNKDLNDWMKIVSESAKSKGIEIIAFEQGKKTPVAGGFYNQQEIVLIAGGDRNKLFSFIPENCSSPGAGKIDTFLIKNSNDAKVAAIVAWKYLEAAPPKTPAKKEDAAPIQKSKHKQPRKVQSAAAPRDSIRSFLESEIERLQNEKSAIDETKKKLISLKKKYEAMVGVPSFLKGLSKKREEFCSGETASAWTGKVGALISENAKNGYVFQSMQLENEKNIALTMTSKTQLESTSVFSTVGAPYAVSIKLRFEPDAAGSGDIVAPPGLPFERIGEANRKIYWRLKVNSVPAFPAALSDKTAGTNVLDLLSNSDGTYYIATDGGLSIRVAPGQYKNYSISDGLVSNLIYDLEKDDKGRLWIATEGGISIFDKDKFINFPRGKDFVDSGFVSLKWSSGKMIAATESEGDVIFEGDLITRVLPNREKMAEYAYETEPVKFIPKTAESDVDLYKTALGDGEIASYPKNYIPNSAKPAMAPPNSPEQDDLAKQNKQSGAKTERVSKTSGAISVTKILELAIIAGLLIFGRWGKNFIRFGKTN